MQKAWIILLILAVVPAFGVTRAQGQKPLDVYFIDVEGGQATLFVSPSGESLLVDTGFPGARDADRIAAVAKQAGGKQIDYLVITHYHGDHVGGVPEMAARLPIRNFVDHGPTVEQGDTPEALFRAYLEARKKGRHLQVKPVDKLPIKGIDVQVVSAAGELITRPLAKAGALNPLCRDFTRRPRTKPRTRARWVIEYGRFRMLDIGNLAI